MKTVYQLQADGSRMTALVDDYVGVGVGGLGAPCPHAGCDRLVSETDLGEWSMRCYGGHQEPMPDAFLDYDDHGESQHWFVRTREGRGATVQFAPSA